MAIVVQLTDEILDPTNSLPYITPYGLAGEEIATFFYNIKNLGYTLSNAHFTAFNNFISACKADGSWTKIKAVAPFYGQDINQASVLLKSDLVSKSLTRPTLGGFQLADAQLVKDGSGNVKYIQVPNMADSARVFDTGKIFGDIANSVGYTAFVKASTMTYRASVLDKAVMGANLSDDASQHIGIFLNMTSATVVNLKMRYRNLTIQTRVMTDAEKSAISSIRLNGMIDTVSAYLKGYLNGVKVYDTNALKSVNAIHSEQPIYVLGKASIAGSTINNAFDGNLYFHIRDDGTLTDTQVANLHTNTNTLLTALGKDL